MVHDNVSASPERKIQDIRECFPFIKPYINRSKELTEEYINAARKLGPNSLDPILIPVGIFLGLLNLALIIGLKKTNKRGLTLSQKLYTCLSLVDSVTGIIGLPYFVVVHFTYSWTCFTQAFGVALSTFTVGSGTFVFVTISILRNLSVRKPLLQYNGNAMEKRKRIVYIVLSATTLYCFGKGTAGFFMYNPNFNSRNKTALYWIAISIGLFFELLILVVFNLSSRKTLIKTDKNVQNSQTKSRDKKAVTVLLSITLVYAVAILPLVGYYAYLAYTMVYVAEDPIRYVRAYNLSTKLHSPNFLGTGINALIYMLLSPQIKRYYRNLVCKKKEEIKQKPYVLRNLGTNQKKPST